MTPDAIVVFSGDIVRTPNGHWRSSTFDESDAFGTLGGRDRVEAAALLAKQYPHASIVTTARRISGELPTQASVYADEIMSLGVGPARIMREERSTSTGNCVTEICPMAAREGWRAILFLSSEYHLPRIQEFVDRTPHTCTIETVSSESILLGKDPQYADEMARIRALPSYAQRLASEQRGIEALRSGKYHQAGAKDKEARQ